MVVAFAYFVGKLTDTEREVCKLLREGMATSKVAKQLGVRRQAVSEIKEAIRKKVQEELDMRIRKVRWNGPKLSGLRLIAFEMSLAC
jgi:DNA-binding NarL/FixJ family response regulator